MLMTKREVAMLRELSSANGISASDLVRMFIRDAYRKYKKNALLLELRTLKVRR